jgi:hypothetical protein
VDLLDIMRDGRTHLLWRRHAVPFQTGAFSNRGLFKRGVPLYGTLGLYLEH